MQNDRLPIEPQLGLPWLALAAAVWLVVVGALVLARVRPLWLALSAAGLAAAIWLAARAIVWMLALRD
jgi:hypothetical protein